MKLHYKPIRNYVSNRVINSVQDSVHRSVMFYLPLRDKSVWKVVAKSVWNLVNYSVNISIKDKIHETTL